MKRLLVVLALVLACDSKDDTADAAAAALSAILPPLPSPSPSLTPPPSPNPSAAAARDAAADAGPCDGHDCPLQAWMKANMYPHMKVNDYEGLARELEACAKLAPPNHTKTGYPNWVSISLDGANASRAADMEAVKAACRGCHEQYKDKYRAEMRARPLSP